MAESETKMDTHDLGKNRCQITVCSGTRWSMKKQGLQNVEQHFSNETPD